MIREAELNNKELKDILECLKSLSTIEYNSWSDIIGAFNERQASGNILTFVYEDENIKKVIGVLTLRLERKLSHGGRLATDIQDVAINKKYQLKGIGKALIEYAISYSKALGAYKISLQCKENLKKYYANLGFDFCDVYEMRKDL